MTKEKPPVDQSENEILYVSIGAAIYDKSTKKFLVVKDADETGEYYKRFGPWELPGGRIKKGETDIDALKREVAEEVGLEEIEIAGVVDAGLAQLPYKDGIQGFLVTYLAYFKGDEIKLSPEHSEFRWVTLEEIEKDKDFKEWFKERIRKVVARIQEMEYLDDLKRLQADFENYKKRMENERKDTMRFITTGIISDLVPILDNFNMAVAHVPEDKKSDPWVTGITYIEKQFEEVIAGYGVNIMDVKPGDDFDPTRHEAIGSQQITDNNEQETENTEAHKIVKVLQKGYTMDDKVIRAAKVTVS